MTPLTKEQKEEYLNNPNHCPYCDSVDIHSGYIESDNNQAWATITCDECGEDWREVYTLTGIEEVED